MRSVEKREFIVEENAKVGWIKSGGGGGGEKFIYLKASKDVNLPVFRTKIVVFS